MSDLNPFSILFATVCALAGCRSKLAVDVLTVVATSACTNGSIAEVPTVSYL